MSDKSDKGNVTKSGDQYKATVTRYFDSQDEAASWVDATTYEDTPEQAASEMTEEDAEKINSNVNPAPMAPGAEQALSGAGQPEDDSKEEDKK